MYQKGKNDFHISAPVTFDLKNVMKIETLQCPQLPKPPNYPKLIRVSTDLTEQISRRFQEGF